MSTELPAIDSQSEIAIATAKLKELAARANEAHGRVDGAIRKTLFDALARLVARQFQGLRADRAALRAVRP